MLFARQLLVTLVKSSVLYCIFLDFITYIQLGFEKNLRQITAEFVNHNDLRENQIDDPNARLQAFHTQSFFLSQFHRTFSSQAKNGPPKSCLLLWTKIVRILCQENACWLILLLWMQLVRPFGLKKAIISELDLSWQFFVSFH